MPSFSPISFSSVSFDIGQENVTSTGSKKRNKFRDYIRKLGQDLRNFFRIKPTPQPPEPEPIPIPKTQTPKTVAILAKQPETIQEAEQIQTINDKWSIVASAPAPKPIPIPTVFEPAKEIPIPPAIGQPKIIPLLQKQAHFQSYKVGEGEHIESEFQPIPKPRPKLNSKVASILVNLLVLSEMEAMLDVDTAN